MAEPMPRHVQAGSAKTLDVFGVSIRVLVSGAETGGRFSLFEEDTPAGAGPPLHIHTDAEEFFRVIAGNYRFRIGSKQVEAGPGDTLLVPRGTPHCFLSLGPEPGTLAMGLVPGGGEGFFAAVQAEGLSMPGDGERIAQLAGQFGLQLLGANPLKG